MRRHLAGAAIVALLLGGETCPAEADGSCLYIDTTGFIRQVPRIQDVPGQYRAKAKCSAKEEESIAEPKNVELSGNVRSTSFSTDLGRMNVRWQRSIEECFGKSPARAVRDAAAASNRAIKNARFAAEARQGKRDWQLVFTDKESALREFPASITLGGHPGFMIPPSQIYIIADFVSGNCSGVPVADTVLTQVLLHEMGHVVEYMIVSDMNIPPDRARSEGFASWFEQYSADFDSDVPRGTVRQYYDGLAREALGSESSVSFDGSAQAYAVSALRFRAIVERKGISGLMRVYETMREKGLPFDSAVKEQLHWNDRMLHREMVEALTASR